MIRIIEGGFGSGAHGLINEEIKKCTINKRRAYLIVPEQQTVIAEAELAEYLPPSAPLYFEVTNFTRLANTLFRALGGVDANYSDKTKKALIMWRTLTELSPAISMTGGKEVNSGVVERALAAVAQMDSLGIDAATLNALHGTVPRSEGRLITKLYDLGAVMSLYKKLLYEKYADTADDVSEMLKKLREHPEFFSDTSIFIEGFTSFTEGQYELIGMLSKFGELTVHLTIPRSMPEAFEYTEVATAKKRIIGAADKYSAEKKLIRIDGCDANPYIAECIKLLWRTDSQIDNNSLQFNNEIEIIECPTPYDECDYIAADIRRRVKLGARYRDFAVIARHADKYTGVLDLALSKAAVPHFLSRRQDAEGAEAVKLLYTAFAVISGGYKKEDVIAYTKCTPNGISRDACDEFTLYCEMWGISGKRFTDGELFNMNPDGYTTRHSSDMGERLIEINATRNAVISPLMRLDTSLKKAKTVRDYAAALVDFMTDIKLAESITARASILTELGETVIADEYSVLWDMICSALDTLVECVGESETTTDAFLSQLKIAISSADIGRIPSYYDTVAVGSADMIRLYGKRHIYIIGVNRGELPEVAADSSYFTDRDKATLSSLGLNIDTDAKERNAREMYIFLRAMSYASESVSVLYTKKTTGLGDTQPSEIIDRLVRVSGGKISVKKMADSYLHEYIYTPEMALESLGKLDTPSRLAANDALKESGFGERVDVSSGDITNASLYLSEGSAKAVAGGTLALTQSRIDDYNSCPLLYFLRYNLSLNTEERAEFDSRNIGSFIHAILESFFGEVARGGISLDSLDEEMTAAMVERGARDYIASLGEVSGMTRREEVLTGRLCRAAMPVVKGLCEEFKNSSFIPRYFELKLENDNENLPEPAKFTSEEGGEVYVYGSIDRVDTCKIGGELYVRVVDYKTGKKDFSPSDIEKGKNLQMFLYLKSVVDTKNENFLIDLGVEPGKKPIPAGVVYVKTEVGDIQVKTPDGELAARAIDEAQKRKGMILAEDEVLSATGAKYAPVRILKSGAIHGSDINKAYTREGWEKITETLGEVVGSIAANIRRGDIKATPSDADACTYCKFKPLCRAAK